MTPFTNTSIYGQAAGTTSAIALAPVTQRKNKTMKPGITIPLLYAPECFKFIIFYGPGGGGGGGALESMVNWKILIIPLSLFDRKLTPRLHWKIMVTISPGFQIDPVCALPHWNRGSLCQVTTPMRVRNTKHFQIPEVLYISTHRPSSLNECCIKWILRWH